MHSHTVHDCTSTTSIQLFRGVKTREQQHHVPRPIVQHIRQQRPLHHARQRHHLERMGAAQMVPLITEIGQTEERVQQHRWPHLETEACVTGPTKKQAISNVRCTSASTSSISATDATAVSLLTSPPYLFGKHAHRLLSVGSVGEQKLGLADVAHRHGGAHGGSEGKDPFTVDVGAILRVQPELRPETPLPHAHFLCFEKSTTEVGGDQVGGTDWNMGGKSNALSYNMLDQS
ncbi:hypothetical protein B0H14DRAFT_3712250 [Mycena olivaceomarginata]|nr:hypothetical protein B0H14DRAFT_3712250 [Mycena olivaceomarginata]